MRAANILLGCRHPSGPLSQRLATPGSPFSYPAGPCPALAPQKQHQIEHEPAYKPRLRKVQAPIFSVFAFIVLEARIHPFHTPITLLYRRLSRELPGMPHARSRTVRQSRPCQTRYSCRPGPHQGGTPYEFPDGSSFARPASPCPFPFWLCTPHPPFAAPETTGDVSTHM